MVQQISSTSKIDYPDSDGQPMADNTLQFQWIVTIKENLELLFANNPDVFVAGDLLWYPVEGDNKIRRAPDAMVAFGRPKGDRGSYQQWKEANIAPQVVFEVLSPESRLLEIELKRRFYEVYGVEEYYLYNPYNPEKNDLAGWQRSNGAIDLIDSMYDWQSPRLGIRFELDDQTLKIFTPDNQPFLTFQELDQKRQEAEFKLQQEQQLRQQEQQLRQQEQQLRQQEQQLRLKAEDQVAKLQAKLRELGIDPEAE